MSFNKEILDACCGGRHFWFDKEDEDALFIDKRIEPKGSIKLQPNWSVNPDLQGDYTDLKFDDESFSLIVFDPPHKVRPDRGIITKKYGSLGDNWKEDISKAFPELWRVLKVNGTLVFKWCDLDISIREITDLFDVKPRFGTVTKKGVNNTYFLVYFKSKMEESKK